MPTMTEMRQDQLSIRRSIQSPMWRFKILRKGQCYSGRKLFDDRGQTLPRDTRQREWRVSETPAFTAYHSLAERQLTIEHDQYSGNMVVTESDQEVLRTWFCSDIVDLLLKVEGELYA